MSDVKMYHFCIDVAGALSWPKAEFDRIFEGNVSKPSGKAIKTKEFRKILVKEFSAGHLVIPIGERCNNWDPREGCLGHEHE